MSQVTSGNRAQVTTPSDEEILIVREFDAPKHLVYKAYTTPELVRRWWPGERGEMETCEIDLRVGGRWRYAMVAKGGFQVAFHGEYSEIVPNERLVTTEVYEGAPPGLEDPINIVTFEESGGRTTLSIVMKVESREVRDMIIDSGMEGGLQEGMDILEQIARELA
ncbi:MAG TPA: SRPBCC family protein [Solirubrobacteraceae bacterium]|nr:SRPBCC family protein [Solirubrobacteraceae bacterium]